MPQDDVHTLEMALVMKALHLNADAPCIHKIPSFVLPSIRFSLFLRAFAEE